MSNTLNATALAVQLAIIKARAALLKASLGSVNRWPAGAPGSKGGQFAPSAAGESGTSSSDRAKSELEDALGDVRSTSIAGGWMMRTQVDNYLKARGFSDQELHDFKQVLDGHSRDHSQADSDAQIERAIAEKSRLFDYLNARADAEQIAIEHAAASLAKQMDAVAAEARRDAEYDKSVGRFSEEYDGPFDEYVQRKVDDARQGIQSAIDHLRNPTVYRKGAADKAVLSTTIQEGGAVTNAATGGNATIRPDHQFTKESLEKLGYRMVAGHAGLYGYSGEGERLFVRLRGSVAKASFSSVNRWPAGSAKGGQFAPKGGAGVTAPQLGLGGNTWKEAGWAGSGMWTKPTAPPPGAKPHPQKDDKGNAVTVNYPTPASPSDTWGNPKAVATFTPGGKTPEVLNGVPFKSWQPPKAGWAAVSGTNEKLDQDFPFDPHPTKHTGAGVIIMEPDGRVWLTKPTNEFGGYKQTFPKGTAESGLTLQQNAIKEAWEETGLKIKIVGIAADIERDTSKARFYFARRVGGTPKDMGWESQALRLAPRKQALELLNRTHDKKLLADVLDELGIRKAKGQPTKEQSTGKPGAWQFQERWPGGSALGGQWKAMGPDGITAPPKIAGGLTGSNSIYQKVANALHEAAQAGDFVAADKAMSKYLDANTKFNQGIKSSQHVKWGAQVFEYASAVKGDLKAKASATATADKLQGPQLLTTMTKVGGKPGGSNPGGVYTDAQGKWLVKGSNAATGQALRAQNEVLASKLMLAVGAGAPEMKLVHLMGMYGGGLGVASKWVDDGQAFDPKNPAHLAAAQADFAVHAWLANYDVLGLGMDNTQIVGGKAVNIDPGGALLYRAQGAPKGDSFKNTADEWDSLRNASINPNGAKVYGAMTASQLIASADKLYNINDEGIKKLVNTYGPGTLAEKDALTAKLIARKADILARVAALQGEMEATPAPAPASAPAPAVAAPAAASTTETVKTFRYEMKEGGSNKWWQGAVVGNTLVTQYGKIGTKGSETVKTFGSNADANAALKKLIGEKAKKGYETVGMVDMTVTLPGATPVAAAPTATPAAAPASPPAAPPAPAAPPPAASPATPSAAIRAAPLGSLLNPVFTGLSHATFDKHAAALKAMTLDQLTAPGLLALKGGKMQFSTPAGLLTLNNPPKTIDGKKFINLFNALKESKQKEAAAAAAAATTPTIAKPVKWPSLGVAAGYYQKLADAAEEAHAAGDLPKLKQMASTSSGGPAFAGTANGKVMAEYHAKLVADLEKKQATQTMATVQAAQAAVSQPATVPAKGTAPNGAAMPDFGKLKLPASNSNAPSHNAKVDKIAELAGKGDVKGLLSLNYGTNNYAKKQAQLANDALKALGSAHQVSVGQKANSHTALFGGQSKVNVAAAAGLTKQPMPAAHPAAKLTVNPALLPATPTFITSNVAVKTENEGHAQALKMLAEAGDLKALKDYDKFSQKSQKLTEYKQNLVESLESQLFPAKGKSGVHRGAPPIATAKTPLDALAAHAAHFKPVSVTEAFKVEAHHKIAAYVVLGKTDAATVMSAFDSNWSPGKLPSSLVSKHSAIANGATSKQKSDISKYVGSWSYGANDQMRNKGHITSEIRSVSESIHALAQELPAGTSLKRNLSLSGVGLKALQAAQPGDIIQSPQFESTADSAGHYGDGKNVQLRLVTSPGVRGIYIGKSLGLGGESEMLMPENARYAIKRVFQEGGRTIVEAVVLPTVKGSLEPGKP